MIWHLCAALSVVALVCVLVALLAGTRQRGSQPTIAANPYPPHPLPNGGRAWSPMNTEPSTPCPWGESGPRKGEAAVLSADTRIIVGKRYEA